MKLYYKNNLFICQCDYKQRMYPKKAGFKWNQIDRVWYTDSKASAFLLSNELGMKFEGFEDLVDKSVAKTSSLKVPAPKGLEYRPFQLAGIEYALEKNSCIIADEMGLGKTIQAIGLINYLTAEENRLVSAIVVCPNSLKYNWAQELKRWIVHKRPVFILSAQGFVPSYKKDRGDIIIINYDILRKLESLWKRWEFDIAIFDEAHYLKNENAMRTYWSFQIKASRKILLTGTPIMNRPKELFSLLNLIESPLAQNRYAFMHRYCLQVNPRGVEDENGAKNLTELNARLRDTCMVRRMKRDVLSELPEKVRQLVQISPSTKQEQDAIDNEMKAFYDAKKKRDEMIKDVRMKKELEKISEEEYKQEVQSIREFVVASIQEIARLRIQTALIKIPHIVNAVETLLENKEKVIIFAYHHVVIDGLYQKLSKYGAVVITGATTIEDRDKNVKLFQDQESNIKIIILNIKAGGVGITLHASSNVIFAELDWTPASISQAEDRAHRIGQKTSVNIYHYVMQGSIDGYLAKKIIEKQEIIDKSINYKSPESIDMFEIIPNQKDEKSQMQIEQVENNPEGNIPEGLF